MTSAPSVAAAGTSFYWAMRLLPEARREAMFAVYAYCREVDDIADSDDPPAAKRAGLAAWRREIDAIYAGKPQTALVRVLAEVAGAFRLRREDFLAVIDGMEMDAAADIRAPAWPSSISIAIASRARWAGCRCASSAAISPAADRVAQHLGRALQLTNILRDLAEDAERGRLYLPREYLRDAGISDDRAAGRAAPCRARRRLRPARRSSPNSISPRRARRCANARAVPCVPPR